PLHSDQLAPHSVPARRSSDLISRNEGTQRTDEKLYQSSHERGNGERSHDTQSIESDSRKIGQSHEQHAINFEHARQDVRRKRREFASDFDKWTRGNGK